MRWLLFKDTKTDEKYFWNGSVPINVRTTNLFPADTSQTHTELNVACNRVWSTNVRELYFGGKEFEVIASGTM